MDLNLLTDQQAHDLREMIASAHHILITGHSRPDGDALGACLAWSYYLADCFGKESTLIVPNGYPDFLHWLPGNERIVRYDKRPDDA